jgi:hypothetical protein
MDLFEGVARPVIDWWAVLAAGVAGFAVGGLWYSPLLFAKAWMQEMKLSEADIRKDEMARIMGLSLLFTGLLAYCLARLMQRWGGWEGGAKVGLLVGVAVALVLAVNALYETRSLRLWAINAGHWLVTCVVMGAILGAWR